MVLDNSNRMAPCILRVFLFKLPEKKIRVRSQPESSGNFVTSPRFSGKSGNYQGISVLDFEDQGNTKDFI